MRAMRITNERLKEMTDSIRLSDLMRPHRPELHMLARNKYCICPCHTENTASLCVNDKMGIFHCFGCGIHGGHLEFLSRTLYGESLTKIKSFRWNEARDNLEDFWPPTGDFMGCVRKLSQITGISIK
jgi:hypothetical protein